MGIGEIWVEGWVLQDVENNSSRKDITPLVVVLLVALENNLRRDIPRCPAPLVEVLLLIDEGPKTKVDDADLGTGGQYEPY